MSLKLTKIKIKELQKLVAVCAECKNAGITTVDAMIAEIDTELNRRITANEFGMKEEHRLLAKQKKLAMKNAIDEGIHRCPKCDSVTWSTEEDLDGVAFMECKKCRYSQLVE